MSKALSECVLLTWDSHAKDSNGLSPMRPASPSTDEAQRDGKAFPKSQVLWIDQCAQKLATATSSS